jgi:hypothetical protein
MDSPFFIYLAATFLVLYGLRSLIAGIKNEKRSYWVSIGWDDTKKLLKEKYEKVYNIVWGAISFILGVLIFILYKIK